MDRRSQRQINFDSPERMAKHEGSLVGHIVSSEVIATFDLPPSVPIDGLGAQS